MQPKTQRSVAAQSDERTMSPTCGDDERWMSKRVNVNCAIRVRDVSEYSTYGHRNGALGVIPDADMDIIVTNIFTRTHWGEASAPDDAPGVESGVSIRRD
jgi:hypothetical protein